MTNRWLLFLVVLGISLAVLVGITMFSEYRSPYGFGYGGMMGPWMMGTYGIGGIFLGVLFLALVIGGGVWLVRSRPGGAVGETPSETPFEILKRRYASGEITKQQYEAMERDVSQ
jgi:putative membrane protein